MQGIGGYIHERPGWPGFTWDAAAIAGPLAALRFRQGRLVARMEALGLRLRDEAVLAALSVEVRQSSAIEGESLDPAAVRSSLARRLGVEIGALAPADRHVDGVVDMVLDATRRAHEPLTHERLLGWQAALFPGGFSGLRRVRTGAYRDDASGPMQVVSGPIGREHVHFEAPAAERLARELSLFLSWFESPGELDGVLVAGLAHLWFVTLHPFDDGNGRIARAISDLALARSERTTQRFYSVSAQIRIDRAAYYRVLEETQRGGLDVTPWLLWFLRCLDDAFTGAEGLLAKVLAKDVFWRGLAGVALNERQRAMVNRLLDGFEGRLTSSKWAALAKCSPDTALRDIDDLVTRGVLRKLPGGGRSTAYELALPAT